MKKRYWSCYKCGTVKRRYKKEESKTCRCGYQMFKTRKTDKANKIGRRINNKEWKIENKIQRFKDKQYSKLRNEGGEILKFNKETRLIWKRIRKSKTINTFQKCGQLFIDSLYNDISNCKEKSMNKSINEFGKVEKHKGHWSSIPKLVIVNNTTYKGNDGNRYGCLGQYRRSFLQGIHQIEISKDVKDLSKIKQTFLHELVHWIDDVTDRKNVHHDKYFWMRLELLKKKFKL